MPDTERLQRLRLLNSDFARAERAGEPWALNHAEMVRGIDGKSIRRHPERTPREDGEPRNWCGSCPHPEGCISCDLDENHKLRKALGNGYGTR